MLGAERATRGGLGRAGGLSRTGGPQPHRGRPTAPGAGAGLSALRGPRTRAVASTAIRPGRSARRSAGTGGSVRPVGRRHPAPGRPGRGGNRRTSRLAGAPGGGPGAPPAAGLHRGRVGPDAGCGGAATARRAAATVPPLPALRITGLTHCGTTTAITRRVLIGAVETGPTRWFASGDRAWFFSDTYLGSPAARKTLFYASSIRNSIVLQQGGTLARTITGGNTCQEHNTSLSFYNRYAHTPAAAPDASSGGFYWTGDQMIVGSNVVKFYYHGTPSSFPFSIDSSAVATIPISSVENDSTVSITPTRFTDLCANGPTSLIWGQALLNWDGYVYIYGWSTSNSQLLYLARATAANLTNTPAWQTFDGLDSSGNPVWSSCSNVSPLPITRGSGMSVAPINGSLWLIQEDGGSGLAGGPITAHPASEPWLFGNNEVVLYNPPEASHSYPYYHLTYEARLQPGLGSNGNVVISYNVNTTAVDTGCVSANAHDASIYRPRFVDVPTSAFDASATTAATVSAGPARFAAPAYGIQDGGPASAAASEPVNAAGTSLSSAAGSGPTIDGVSDWYDQWGPLAGGCPAPPGALLPERRRAHAGRAGHADLAHRRHRRLVLRLPGGPDRQYRLLADVGRAVGPTFLKHCPDGHWAGGSGHECQCQRRHVRVVRRAFRRGRHFYRPSRAVAHRVGARRDPAAQPPVRPGWQQRERRCG